MVERLPEVNADEEADLDRMAPTGRSSMVATVLLSAVEGSFCLRSLSLRYNQPSLLTDIGEEW